MVYGVGALCPLDLRSAARPLFTAPLVVEEAEKFNQGGDYKKIIFDLFYNKRIGVRGWSLVSSSMRSQRRFPSPPQILDGEEKLYCWKMKEGVTIYSLVYLSIFQ